MTKIKLKELKKIILINLFEPNSLENKNILKCDSVSFYDLTEVTKIFYEIREYKWDIIVSQIFNQENPIKRAAILILLEIRSIPSFISKTYTFPKLLDTFKEDVELFYSSMFPLFRIKYKFEFENSLSVHKQFKEEITNTILFKDIHKYVCEFLDEVFKKTYNKFLELMERYYLQDIINNKEFSDIEVIFSNTIFEKVISEIRSDILVEEGFVNNRSYKDSNTFFECLIYYFDSLKVMDNTSFLLLNGNILNPSFSIITNNSSITESFEINFAKCKNFISKGLVKCKYKGKPTLLLPLIIFDRLYYKMINDKNALEFLDIISFSSESFDDFKCEIIDNDEINKIYKEDICLELIDLPNNLRDIKTYLKKHISKNRYMNYNLYSTNIFNIFYIPYLTYVNYILSNKVTNVGTFEGTDINYELTLYDIAYSIRDSFIFDKNKVFYPIIFKFILTMYKDGKVKPDIAEGRLNFIEYTIDLQNNSFTFNKFINDILFQIYFQKFFNTNDKELISKCKFTDEMLLVIGKEILEATKESLKEKQEILEKLKKAILNFIQNKNLKYTQLYFDGSLDNLFEEFKYVYDEIYFNESRYKEERENPFSNDRKIIFKIE